MPVWLNISLILAGAAMMSGALIRALTFTSRIPRPGARRAWRLLSLLMAVFLAGYGLALALVLQDRPARLVTVAAFVFAAGALYVLLTVSLTVRLTGHLEELVKERTAELQQRTRDLEDAKRAAEEANRAKSRFLANMSHELRTPLNSVVGFSNILRKNKDDQLSNKDLLYLERIVDNGKRLLSLINDVLDLSKIEAGHMEVTLEDVDLAELVQDTVGQFAAELRTTPVKLLTEIPPRMAPIATDRGKLTQVLVNLISNALKFTERGQVRVRLAIGATSRRPARIEVVDSGIGIPADQLERIFEEFQQADGNTGRQYGGTGLGLSISRSLCRLMGYEITATSRGRDLGSTFVVTLLAHPDEPVVEPHELRHSREIRPLTDEELQQSLAAALSHKTVLVISDQSNLAHYVRDLGAVVLEAGSRDEGLGLARNVLPDLITAEAGSEPLAEGGLLDELRTSLELHDVPLLIVGSDGDESGVRPPGVDRISRPLRPEELLQVLWRNLFR